MSKKLIKILPILLSMFINSYAQDSFWLKTNKPSGGVIYSVINKNDTLFIAGKGGVYQSVDLGNTWTSIGLQATEVTDLAISGNYLLAIGRGGCYRMNFYESQWEKVISGYFQTIDAKDSIVFLGSGFRGIYRSKNYGKDWEENNNGIDNYDIDKIFITSSNVVLASAAGTSGSGVFRSFDWGDSWKRIDPYQFAWNFEGITEFNNTLYAFDFVNQAKVYKSTDNGLTWFLPEYSSPPADIINTIYADNKGLYVGVDNYGFFRSTNEGASWVKINNGLENLTLTDISGNSSKLFLTNFDGFYSTDKDHINWEKHNTGINDLEIYTIAQNSKYIFIGSSGSGLFRAKKDLSELEEMDIGYNNKFVTSVLAVDSLLFVLVSSWSDHYYSSLYVSSNNGETWRKLNPNLDSAELETIVGNRKVLFIGSGFGVFRSTNNGETWEKMTNGMPNNINSSSIAVYDSVVIVTDGTSDIYRSENLGESWEKIYVPELFSGQSVAVSPTGDFYLGSGSVNILFKSTNLGESWAKLNNPLFNSSVTSISFSSSAVYVGLSSDGILKSTNNGETWSESNLDLFSKSVKSISAYDYYVFVGTNSGLYQEVNSTVPVTPIADYPDKIDQNYLHLHWRKSPNISSYRFQLSTDSLFQTILIDQVINDTTYYLNSLNYLTTYYWRVSSVTKYWDDIFSDFQKIVVSNPLNFKLYNNYPNPFNNETNVRVDVPIKSEIKLILYNSLGERIKIIKSSIVDAGTHYYKINSNNLASGIYFVRLIARNYSKTIKVVVLK